MPTVPGAHTYIVAAAHASRAYVKTVGSKASVSCDFHLPGSRSLAIPLSIRFTKLENKLAEQTRPAGSTRSIVGEQTARPVAAKLLGVFA